jgi:RNA polymerase sigma-70 factor (sigma-E family)
MRRTAFLLSGDWYLADDLVQETLTRMYVVWPRVSAAGDPGAYARRVLLNLHTDHRRRPAQRELVVQSVPDVVAAGPSESSDERQALLAALMQVPPGQRAVLVLRFWEDLSVEQAAAVLGTSVGNVKSQTSRGLVALREAVALQGRADLCSGKELT